MQRIEIKINPEKITDAMVCEILQSIPKGDRSEYVKKAIIAYAKGDIGVCMEGFVRKLIREELQNGFAADGIKDEATIPEVKTAAIESGQEQVLESDTADNFFDDELFADMLDGLESLS